jgi:hypothetical protein
MRSAVVFAAALVAAPSLASAGTYVSLGLGLDPSGQGELALMTETADTDTPTQRVALGHSLGRLAVEASLGRFGLGAGEAVVAGAHARMSVPLDGNLGAFARFGVERAWLSDLDARLGDTADGMVGGLGLEYRLSMPLLGQAALWAEVSQDQLTFADDSKGGVRLWSIGASLGL